MVECKFDIHSYDKYIVTFSGGKDSTACFLYLLDQGIPVEKIELWHQDIDGREGAFFDWEITPDYCRQFAKAFDVPIYFQWKAGGFKREMLRSNSLTAPILFENTDGTISSVGGTGGKLNTRMKFPQLSPDLSVRWCSGYLKIDVCSAAIRNQERFKNIRTLVLSGERGEESPQRAKYNILEPDRADLRNGKLYTRHVDRFRPLRDKSEQYIWNRIKRYRIRVHPCYYMGWSRCSCKWCIFGNKDQFASAHIVSPDTLDILADYEDIFKCTIKRNIDIRSLAISGTPYKWISEELIKLVTSKDYTLSILLSPGEEWILPPGAFGESCGPV